MKLVKISDAKNNFSRHVKYVKRGGRIRILDREIPVADLVPIQPTAGAGGDDAWLMALERRGLVRRGRGGRLPSELLRPGPSDPKGLLLQALLDERRHDR